MATPPRSRKSRLTKALIWTASIAAVYVTVLLLIEFGVVTSYLQATIATICINIILAASLNLITGFTGQFSLGHAGFMAIGAYVTALTILEIPTLTGLIIGLVAGSILSALVGFVVGLPTLRLQGDYLAIATLGMAEIIRVSFLNMQITNGAAGLSGMPRMVGWTGLFAATAITLLIIRNFLNSSPGRACVAIREDEIAAESVGVGTARIKVLAFSLGAFFGGLAGGLYSSYFYFIKPDLFNFMKSVDILVIVVLGGLGSLSGTIIAAVLLAIISTLLQPFPEIRMIIYSLALVLLMLFRPQGIMGNSEVSDAVLSRFKKKIPDTRSSAAANPDAALTGEALA